MTLDWQNLVALGLVFAAGLYVGRRLVHAARRRGTAGCGACPANARHKCRR